MEENNNERKIRENNKKKQEENQRIFRENIKKVIEIINEQDGDKKIDEIELQDKQHEKISIRNENYLHLCGDPHYYSPGTKAVMADRQIKRGMKKGIVSLEEIGNAKAIVTYLPTKKWFIAYGGWGNGDERTAMMGAACGDVAGSVYEHHNIKFKPDVNKLIQQGAFFTDDTVMTCAVADGLRKGLALLPKDWLHYQESESILFNSVQEALLRYGKKYPHAGYGGRFRRWLSSSNPQPYGSLGNGSAMRASYAGWAALTLEEAEKLGEITARVTHNHPEGIKGAKVVAGSIFILRNGGSKADVKEYAEQYYNLDFSLNEIRDNYRFDVTCKGSVPQAIVAFMQESNFADVIASTISIGGDSDTIAAIAGSIAEAIYPIPQGIRGRVIDRMDKYLLNTIVEAVDFVYQRLPD